jgi:hypothetical protein
MGWMLFSADKAAAPISDFQASRIYPGAVFRVSGYDGLKKRFKIRRI